MKKKATHSIKVKVLKDYRVMDSVRKIIQGLLVSLGDLARAQSDDNYSVRRAAVQELAQVWKEHPDTFRFLINCAVNDPFVRGEGEFAKYETNTTWQFWIFHNEE